MAGRKQNSNGKTQRSEEQNEDSDRFENQVIEARVIE
jgi:hypothetical protein